MDTLGDGGAYVTNSLSCVVYMNGSSDYIELYGYDIWEKMFKFPNWNEDENENEEYEEETNIYENEEYYN